MFSKSVTFWAAPLASLAIITVGLTTAATLRHSVQRPEHVRNATVAEASDSPREALDEVVTFDSDKIVAARPKPRPVAARATKAVDCSNARVRTVEDLRQGTGQVLYCHN